MNLKTNEYRISLGDQLAFILTWLKKNWLGKTNRQRFLLYMGVICVLAAFGLFYPVQQMYPDMGDYFIWFLLFVLLALAIFSAIASAIMVFAIGPVLILIWQTISYPFSSALKRQQSVHLSEDGLTKHVKETSSHLPWADVFDLKETTTTLLFFTNANCAMIVPKAAFATHEDADHFAKAARNYYDSAKSIF